MDKDFDLKILQSTRNLLFKSNNVMSEALDIARKSQLDISSTKLCDFLKFNFERKTWSNAINKLMNKKIFSTGEVSGDLHGSLLSKALMKREKIFRF